jgi:hypothetical protein
LVVAGGGDVEDGLHVGAGSYASDDRDAFCDVLIGGKRGERCAGGHSDRARLPVASVRQLGVSRTDESTTTVRARASIQGHLKLTNGIAIKGKTGSKKRRNRAFFRAFLAARSLAARHHPWSPGAAPIRSKSLRATPAA